MIRVSFRADALTGPAEYLHDVTRRQQALDIALALAVAAIGQLEVWAGVFGPNLAGPKPAVSASYLLAALALALRRRFPLAVAIFVSAALGIEFLVFGASEGFGTLAPMVVAPYSVAAHEGRRRALLGFAFIAAAGVAHNVRDPGNESLHDHISALPWYAPAVIAWLLGAYLRTRRLYVAELRERADRAEHEREQQAQAAVASERTRIARELHDIVAHSVSVMVVQAEAAEEMLDRGEPARARDPLWKIEDTGRAALMDMRRMLGILREDDSKPALGPQPGIANLELLLAKVRESGLPVELEVEGEPAPLPPGVDLSAYRIVQEALTNSLKYAGPATARVVVRYALGSLELEVSDDGAGSTNGADGGHGLVGMRERVALFGGELHAGPAPSRGYVVRARLPLETAL
jgi:signal transduction histidine kinase